MTEHLFIWTALNFVVVSMESLAGKTLFHPLMANIWVRIFDFSAIFQKLILIQLLKKNNKIKLLKLFLIEFMQ